MSESKLDGVGSPVTSTVVSGENPPYLYKYRTVSSRDINKAIEESKIYLSSRESFNDPYDCYPRIKKYSQSEELAYTRTAIKRVAVNEGVHLSRAEIDRNSKKFYQDLVKTYGSVNQYLEIELRNMLNDIGIYALSSRCDDLAMWAYYSDSHRGFCLQFDRSNTGPFYWAQLVKYVNDYPVIDGKKVALGDKDTMEKALTHKAKCWSHEKEWRLLSVPALDGITESGISQMTGAGVGWHTLDAKYLTGIILGARISNSDEKKIRSWISRSPVNVKMFSATLNQKKFQVDIHQIT